MDDGVLQSPQGRAIGELEEGILRISGTSVRSRNAQIMESLGEFPQYVAHCACAGEYLLHGEFLVPLWRPAIVEYEN